jgi:hypothetical protein
MLSIYLLIVVRAVEVLIGSFCFNRLGLIVWFQEKLICFGVIDFVSYIIVIFVK